MTRSKSGTSLPEGALSVGYELKTINFETSTDFSARRAGKRGTTIKPPAFLMQGEAIMTHPATKKRGGDPDVTRKPRSKDPPERKLEQGLEESMAGSDPVSITQPARGKADKKYPDKEHSN
jgi:hypothetical protein